MPQMNVPAGFTRVARPTTAPEIGIGMLGYQFMGRAHSNAYLKMPYIFWPTVARPRLVAMCGRDAARVAEAAGRYGYEGYYTDWREMLADERIQLFDNCGPHSAHVEPTIAALRAGKHVVCEKPLAMTADDARRMLVAARDSGKKHMCGFNYRFIPAVRLARDLIQQGRLGQIYEFRCQYLQESAHDPDKPLARRPDPAMAKAGSLAGLGCHIIDMARFLVGEPQSVSALLATFESERPLAEGGRVRIESDDAFAALIEFAGGAIGTLEATRVATGRKNRQAWEINGSKGSISFDLERLNELQVYLADGARPDLSGFQDVLVTEPDQPFVRYWWPRGHILGWEHAHINELHHMVAAIANGTDVGPDGATFEDGYRAAVVAEAIAEAATSGSRVEVRYDS
jgi:predicted dehydrogenase